MALHLPSGADAQGSSSVLPFPAIGLGAGGGWLDPRGSVPYAVPLLLPPSCSPAELPRRWVLFNLRAVSWEDLEPLEL